MPAKIIKFSQEARDRVLRGVNLSVANGELVALMGLSGAVNLYLIWLRRPFEVRNLWLSAAWQACNLGGFWLAVVLAPAYGGAVTMPETHVYIFGLDENVVAFAILSALLTGACAALRRAPAVHA